MTELIIIVDESGSMGPQRDATIAAINELVQTQRSQGNLSLTIAAFSTKVRYLAERHDATFWVNLSPKDYIPAGGTALCDSVCEILETFGSVPADTKRIVAIITDGESNADLQKRPTDVKAMVESTPAEFIFIGSGIDAYQEGLQYGINRSMQADLTTHQGTRTAYRALAGVISNLRQA